MERRPSVPVKFLDSSKCKAWPTFHRFRTQKLGQTKGIERACGKSGMGFQVGPNLMSSSQCSSSLGIRV